jgi:hypothetical protein
VTCTCCGHPRTRRPGGGWYGAHNWCNTCTNRWYAAGKPPGGVPPRIGEPERIARIAATCRQQQQDRLTDYAWLLSFGESREQAARRTGVSARTAQLVYEPMLAVLAQARTEGDADAA